MKLLLVVFILHRIFVPSIVQCGSFFRLLNDMEDTYEKGFLQREFFTCSINKSCSYVIKYKKTSKFKIIKDKMELDSLKEPVTIWEKMRSKEEKGKEVRSVSTNIALNKPATLSTQYDSRTVPENAVDGNLFSSHQICAITKRNARPHWFRVDLLQKACITSVALKNRKSLRKTMNPFDVRIGDSLENDGIVNPKCVSGGAFTDGDQYLSFECPDVMCGRYVIVFAEKAELMELCELEVYSSQ